MPGCVWRFDERRYGFEQDTYKCLASRSNAIAFRDGVGEIATHTTMVRESPGDFIALLLDHVLLSIPAHYAIQARGTNGRLQGYQFGQTWYAHQESIYCPPSLYGRRASVSWTLCVGESVANLG